MRRATTWRSWGCLGLLAVLAACETPAGGAAAPDVGNEQDTGQIGDAAADTGGQTDATADAPPPDTTPADTGATDVGQTDAAPSDVGPLPGACQAGTSDPGCPSDQYCATAAVGQCTGQGQCAPKPQACDLKYGPVCGCDGKTYDNECFAAGQGTNVAKGGECGTTGGCTVGGGDCPPNSKCLPPDGQCSAATGSCVQLPGACTKEYNPVCGCDGKTYGNPCMAAAAGVAVAGKGECAAPAGCDIGVAGACPDGQYCAGPQGMCSGKGECAKKPEACITLYDPVCGCDGKTHGNSCDAASAGTNVASKGECPSTGKLVWYFTCGTPVCMGYKPQSEIPLCKDQKAGDPCNAPNAMCDPQDDCQRYLKCTDTDPTMQPGGCPISKAEYKTDIRYVQDAERQRLARDLLDTRLATYRYKALGDQAPRHLGFIIDDQPDSPAVDSRRDMVDLYGYLSMSVAALQEQQKRIDALERQLQEVRSRCGDAAPMSRAP